jgi:hypothetical protein
MARRDNVRSHRGNPAGGRTLLTPEMEEKILTHLRKGAAIAHVAASSGIHPATFHDWMRRADNAVLAHQESGEPIPETEALFVAFAEKVTQARGEGAVTATELVRKAANGGAVIRETTRRYRNEDGEMVEEVEIVRAPPDWRAAAWWLERAHRTEFGKSAIEEGERGGTGLTSSALDDLARRIRANMTRLSTQEITAGTVLDGEVVEGR